MEYHEPSIDLNNIETLAPGATPIATPMVLNPHNNKKRRTLWAIVGVLIAGILITAGWILWKKYHAIPKTPAQVLQALAETSQPVEKTSVDRADELRLLSQPVTTQTRTVQKPKTLNADTQMKLLQSLNKK